MKATFKLICKECESEFEITRDDFPKEMFKDVIIDGMMGYACEKCGNMTYKAEKVSE